MNDSVLILGAGGFIGRHLSESLAASGVTVLAATRRPTTFTESRIHNVAASFDAPEQFAPLLDHCRTVIHAASISTPGSSAAQPQLDGNLRTTLALIEALQASADRRLIYLSSGGTLYGDRVGAASEDDPLRPRSYHGAGKAAAEHFAQAWAAQYDATAVILRPSNVYGPGQPPCRGFGIIPTAFDCTVHGKPLTVWGDGSTIRDYLYIDDLISLCRRVLAHDLPSGAHIYNAAYGKGTSLDALLNAIDQTTGEALPRDYKPARRVDVQHIVPDNAAARAVFGWRPSTPLEQGLRQTWQWFTTQR